MSLILNHQPGLSLWEKCQTTLPVQYTLAHPSQKERPSDLRITRWNHQTSCKLLLMVGLYQFRPQTRPKSSQQSLTILEEYWRPVNHMYLVLKIKSTMWNSYWLSWKSWRNLDLSLSLSLQEWNFKAILCDKLTTLLEQQHIYWKQRETIEWVKFGDEGMEFFHANATIKHNRNLIT